ncbi:hypothetical protein DFAR_3960022 [Desulfarculales bacterium]
MLINPILDKLRALGLEGMFKALEEQLNTPAEKSTGSKPGLTDDKTPVA